MSDWRSYDRIADRYDRVWASRFEVVARHIWAAMPPHAGQTILDVGVGTGIVPGALPASVRQAALCAGCDLSAGMLQRARSRVSSLRLFMADAAALPLRSESVDRATASFVLSHVPDYAAALVELRRVLTPSGLLAVSNWAASTDPLSALWTECLAEVVSRAEVDRAVSEVAPWEGYLSQRGALEKALADAGLAVVRSDVVDVDQEVTVEHFLDDREIGSSGRLGRERLGADAWQCFRRSAAETFRARFGPSVRYQRDALVVIAGRSAATVGT